MNPLLARFQDEPTLVAAERSAWFESCVHGAAAEMSRVTALAQEANENLSADDEDWWGQPGTFKAYLRPYTVRDGVLQIPVKGVLLHDFPYCLEGWACGYDYIWRAFQRGMADDEVRGIALMVDSPGGMVAGCFEMVDKMFAMRGVKPIAGFASEHAYSAAYAAISAVDPGRLYVTRTGGVGSIGVVTSHVDVSANMAQAGYKVTFIYAGAHKVDGNPYEALAPAVKKRIQARIDDLYGVFVASVARNRGLDEQEVRDTEALTFGASDALSNGLADKIGSLDDSLADFSASLNPQTLETDMAEANHPDHEAALATARSEGHAAGVAEGSTNGAVAERARITAILGSDEGKKRPKAALSCALRSGMDVEAASAFLADLAEEGTAAPVAAAPVAAPTAGAPAGMFEAAMDASAQPNVTADSGNAAADADPITLARNFGMAGVSAAAK
jgi:signal peptide peptidase SppA